MADLSDEIRTLMQRGIVPVTPEEIHDRHSRSRRRSRRAAARVASIVVLIAVAVPVALAVTHARSATVPKHSSLARHRVIAALDTTVSSGSFDITFDQQPVMTPTSGTTTTTTPGPTCFDDSGSAPPATSTIPTTTTPTTAAPTTAAPTTTVPGESQIGGSFEQACASFSGRVGLAIAGQGTIDTDPFAMVATSQVPGLGTVTARDNGTDVWEMGGGNYGLTPGSTDTGPGSSLSGFGGLVEGTLGPRQGALDMMGLASPTGYLELDENSITNADEIGTGTVDGAPVTIYQVTLDPAQMGTVTGTNAVEAAAISDALGVLQRQGYTGTTVKIAIDAGGYIRQTISTASFSDGATQTSQTTFSDFGCAGTVLMPGQSGSSSPPTGCVSPDASDTSPTS